MATQAQIEFEKMYDGEFFVKGSVGAEVELITGAIGTASATPPRPSDHDFYTTTHATVTSAGSGTGIVTVAYPTTYDVIGHVDGAGDGAHVTPTSSAGSVRYFKLGLYFVFDILFDK